jgi:hypothetical protein
VHLGIACEWQRVRQRNRRRPCAVRSGRCLTAVDPDTASRSRCPAAAWRRSSVASADGWGVRINASHGAPDHVPPSAPGQAWPTPCLERDNGPFAGAVRVRNAPQSTVVTLHPQTMEVDPGDGRAEMSAPGVIPSALKVASPGRRGVTAKPSWPGVTRPSLQPQRRYRWPGLIPGSGPGTARTCVGPVPYVNI